MRGPYDTGPARWRCGALARRVLPTAAAWCSHHDAAARHGEHLVAEPVVVGPLLLDDGLSIDCPLYRWWERLVRIGQRRDWRYPAPDGCGGG